MHKIIKIGFLNFLEAPPITQIKKEKKNDIELAFLIS